MVSHEMIGEAMLLHPILLHDPRYKLPKGKDYSKVAISILQQANKLYPEYEFISKEDTYFPGLADCEPEKIKELYTSRNYAIRITHETLYLQSGQYIFNYEPLLRITDPEVYQAALQGCRLLSQLGFVEVLLDHSCGDFESAEDWIEEEVKEEMSRYVMENGKAYTKARVKRHYKKERATIIDTVQPLYKSFKEPIDYAMISAYVVKYPYNELTVWLQHLISMEMNGFHLYHYQDFNRDDSGVDGVRAVDCVGMAFDQYNIFYEVTQRSQESYYEETGTVPLVTFTERHVDGTVTSQEYCNLHYTIQVALSFNLKSLINEQAVV